MLTIVLGAILAGVLFYIFFVKPLSYWKEHGVRQGKPLWLFGDNWGPFFLLHSFAEMTQHIYNQCPGARYSGAYQFTQPVLIVKEPELIKQMSVKDFDHFTDHMAFLPEIADPLWNKGLLSLNGQNWRDMRSLLSPSFTSSRMKGMFVLMVECAENFLKHFLKRDEEIIKLEMKDTFTRFTNDVISTTAFGVQVDSMAEPNNTFYLMAKECTNLWDVTKNLKIFACLIVPQLFHVLDVAIFGKEVGDFFRGLITETIETREKKGIVRHDLLNLFMEARKGVEKREENGIIETGFATAQESDLGKRKGTKEITNEDITAQALLFLFAGFESVSGLMCFMAYELAVNPDVQEKLRKEVIATLQESDGKLTYEGLLKMKYMDMVVSEALRKWPPFPSADRICTKPYILQPATPDERPVYLEKGATIWFPTFAMHHDPKFHPNPDQFDPERFSDENKGNIKPYTYFPFGLGPRNCIGSRFALLEAKVIFFCLLQHFEIVPVESTQIPLKLCPKAFTLAASNGFNLGLKRIKK